MKIQLLADGKVVKRFYSPDGKNINFLELCMAISDIIREEFQQKTDLAFEMALNEINKEESLDQQRDEVYCKAIKYAYDALNSPDSDAWKKRYEELAEKRLQMIASYNARAVYKAPSDEVRRTEDESHTFLCARCGRKYVYYGYPEEERHWCEDGGQGGY